MLSTVPKRQTIISDDDNPAIGSIHRGGGLWEGRERPQLAAPGPTRQARRITNATLLARERDVEEVK